MTMTPKCLFLLFVLMTSLTSLASSQTAASISGSLTLLQEMINSNPASTLVINCYQLSADMKSPPTVSQLFKYTPFAVITTSNFSTNVPFTFSNLPVNRDYYLFAYVRPSVTPSLFREFGTVKYNNIAGWFSKRTSGWLSPIHLVGDQKNVSFKLQGTRPFVLNRRSSVNGVLQNRKGHPVLKIWGSPKERGYAQGFLIAEQIIEFFQYFILESTTESSDLYLKYYQPIFADSLAGKPNAMFSLDEDSLEEINAMIQGMIDSGVDMRLEDLDRDFSAVDILAINSYIEMEFLQKNVEGSTRDPTAACSQFSFWNTQTKSNLGLNGNIIAGRNMDGELDIRRATVTHFLIFAVDPVQGSKGYYKRYVSMMWPGFIGTLSGVNEDGLYNMMNYGTSSSDKPDFIGVTPVPSVVRYLLAKQQDLSHFNPQTALQQIDEYKSKTGGTCVTGCVLFFAKPYNTLGSLEIPSFVFEGDWKGGLVRVPTQAQPAYINDTILATNHFHIYGVDPETHDTHVNFGKQVYFNTLSRYDRGAARTESYNRVPGARGQVGFQQLQSLLQIVATGTTEHSVIYRIEGKKIIISVSIADPFDLTTAWDAPYLQWTDFEFNELFAM